MENELLTREEYHVAMKMEQDVFENSPWVVVLADDGYVSEVFGIFNSFDNGLEWAFEEGLAPERITVLPLFSWKG